MKRWILLAGLGLGLASHAQAEPSQSWVVMPVRAERPPPQDPTLLRLSVPLAKTLAAAVSGEVRLAKREERDDHCLDDGWRCPAEIAAMLKVSRVVSLQLDEDYGSLRVLVYAGRRGVVAQTDLDCTWEAGVLSCDAEGLAAFMRTLGPRALGPQEVFDAFVGLQGELHSCAGRGRTYPKVQVNFQVAPSGRAHQVRIEPRSRQRSKVYRCMAQVVEGLEVAPFSGADAGPFTFSLPSGPEGGAASTP